MKRLIAGGALALVAYLAVVILIHHGDDGSAS